MRLGPRSLQCLPQARNCPSSSLAQQSDLQNQTEFLVGFLLDTRHREDVKHQTRTQTLNQVPRQDHRWLGVGGRSGVGSEESVGGRQVGDVFEPTQVAMLHWSSLLAQHLLLAACLVAGVWLMPREAGTSLVHEPEKVLLGTVVVHTLTTLVVYSVGPMRNTRQPLWRRMACGIAGLVLGAMCFHCAAVLYGAPALTNARQTHLWAWLMAALVTAPTACVLGLDAKAWRRLFAQCNPSDASELALCIPAHGAVLGSWVGAWPIPLDWDRPWQLWPIPCVVGAVGGYAIALIVAQVCAARRAHND